MGRREWLGRRSVGGCRHRLLFLVCRLTFALEFGALGPPDACFPLKAGFRARQAEVSGRFHSQERRKLCYSGQNLELATGKCGVHFWFFDLGSNTESLRASWWLHAFCSLPVRYPKCQNIGATSLPLGWEWPEKGQSPCSCGVSVTT